MIVRKNGRKEGSVLFNDALDTFFILWLYGVGHMVKDRSDSKRENPLPSQHELLLWISNGFPYQEGRKEVFYLMMHSTHFYYGYMEGNVLFNDALNTFYLRL